jgi:hypothetical protein
MICGVGDHHVSLATCSTPMKRGIVRVAVDQGLARSCRPANPAVKDNQ